MKEIKISNYTYLEFDNQKIYDRFWQMQNLCRNSFVFSSIVLILYTTAEIIGLILGTIQFGVYSFIPFVMFSSSFSCFMHSKRMYLKPTQLSDKEKEKQIKVQEKALKLKEFLKKFQKKDKKIKLTFPTARIITDFIIPEILLVPILICSIVVGIVYNIGIVAMITSNSIPEGIPLALAMVYVLIIIFIASRVLIWVSVIILAENCKLMAQEWNENPPTYVREEKNKLESIKLQKQSLYDIQTTKQILEQCGMKFFLKYYKLLLLLPVRDVEINENYTPEEKNERLTAAKSLIEQGFSKYAAQHILDNYADLLTDDEKAIAREILAE
ncbi:MAG: hypothetical protein OSJ68_01615 [Clostridia bacterium]|nr:hypothetical protein [Clostridia bacterium]